MKILSIFGFCFDVVVKTGPPFFCPVVHGLNVPGRGAANHGEMVAFPPLARPGALIISLICLVFYLFSTGSVYAGSISAGKLNTEQAVKIARQGQANKGAEILMQLHRQQPENKAITSDLIVVLGWAGKNRQAATLFEQNKSTDYPVYVRFAMVNTYRNLKQTALALKLQNELIAQNPGHDQYLLRKALLLIDENRLDAAAQILGSIAGRAAQNRDFHFASAYLHERQADWYAALNDYETLLQLLPGDAALLRKEVLALSRMRAATLALEKSRLNPKLLGVEQLARMISGRAAELLRWSTGANKDYRESRFFALQALALQLEGLALVSGNQVQRRAIMLDMLITLRTLRQMKNLQMLYESLLRDGPVPDFVHQALADSLLATRHPEQSRKIYQQLAEKNPKNYQANLGLFYSFVEEEDFDSAYRLIDSMAIREPKFRIFWDSKSKYPNERYLDLQVTSIQARFYGNQLEDAWNRINDLVVQAPRNNWLLEVRGQVSRAREWPRQALADYHLAGLIAPESLDAWVGKAASLIDLHRYREARPLLDELLEKHPQEHGTRDLATQWRFSRKPTYWGDITYGNSSGPELNGDGMLASAEVISSPIDDVWKMSAGYRYAWSQIIEGEETFRRSSLGLEYNRGDWDLLGYVNYNDSDVQEAGGKVKVIWQPDDFWNLSLTGERFAESTPLRALYHGIRADAATVSAVYRASEMRTLSANVKFSPFTDGNDRIEGGATVRQRLLDIPHLDIDGRVELYASTNSETNVPYYSPEYDFSLQGALHADHVYHREYDHVFAHQLDVGYGFYEQKGYVSRWIGHIRYEQRYRFSPWVEILAGAEVGQNVYDGHAEPYRLIRFMINGKF